MRSELLRSIAVFCLAGAGLSAKAADGIELYGLVSAGIVHLRDAASMTAPDSVTSLAEQAHNSNRWGLRGSEDLGGGRASQEDGPCHQPAAPSPYMCILWHMNRGENQKFRPVDSFDVQKCGI